MNQTPCLIVFIDGLPYSYGWLLTNYIDENLNLIETIPELGYSSNQHWAMFSGMLPDQVGYFTDINLDDTAISKDSGFYVKYYNPINFLIRYLEKRIVGRNKYNIPVGLGKYFVNKGKYPLSSTNIFSFLDDSIKKFKLRTTIPKDEIKMLDELSKQSLSSFEFVSISLVDHFGHIFIGNKERYIESVIPIISKVSLLWENFKKQNGYKSKLIILSDHGMSESTIEITLKMEKFFGKQSNRKYLYYNDAVIARFWIFDNKIISEIISYLNELNIGYLLTKFERKYYGVENKKFGDLIMILNPPYRFSPNYFGYGIKIQLKRLVSFRKKSISVGIHGYMPNVIEQHGLLAYTGIYKKKVTKLRNSELLKLLKDIFSDEINSSI
ncbi:MULTISPECIES: alkaline phosphatase family protein [unclassified Thermosipho (in: thermotogales)]|uniref:alkaline phosphatase family protein n=1 Tax=unclassified Thermosipho (in: thermotogales) TaxID=2676525 RepID=UPI0009874ED0|nr:MULTISPECIES: alkaline phosphatase family protein [unclassified Thermosipho (in: thermotogales)]MBT1247045.1 hypothetical protein [Thermosipho sp. 1244]OOC46901.1 hypothetical protein XO09_04260 [Thermosipho sp. 1223]